MSKEIHEVNKTKSFFFLFKNSKSSVRHYKPVHTTMTYIEKEGKVQHSYTLRLVSGLRDRQNSALDLNPQT